MTTGVRTLCGLLTMKSGAVAAVLSVLVLLCMYVAQCSEAVPSTTTTTAVPGWGLAVSTPSNG